jgi:hypothetical protein
MAAVFCAFLSRFFFVTVVVSLSPTSFVEKICSFLVQTKEEYGRLNSSTQMAATLTKVFFMKIDI